MQEIAARAWPSSWHPGGLGWAAARGELADRVALFEGASGPAGWAGVSAGGEVLAQIDPHDPSREATARDVVEWCLQASRPGRLHVALASGPGDRALVDAFGAAGFRTAEPAEPLFGMFHPAIAVDAMAPRGYHVRPVQPGEERARVDVHRAAWRPGDLPWHPDHRPAYAPDVTSSYTVSQHRRVTRTHLYDRALDLVAEAADGSLAACCIAWFDPTSRVVEIEPLGVHPAHRRVGLAGALCHAVVERAAALGAREVFLNVGPSVAYPANAAAYAKAGFATRVRGAIYRLERGG